MTYIWPKPLLADNSMIDHMQCGLFSAITNPVNAALKGVESKIMKRWNFWAITSYLILMKKLSWFNPNILIHKKAQDLI